jgi:ArsR family transcriptional regulator
MASKKITKLDRAALERVAKVFALFSEPLRLALIQELKTGEKSVNTLVKTLAASQAHVSRQLTILFDGGLLSRERRGNQVFYSIGEKMVFEMCDLVCGKINRDAEAAAGKRLFL